MESPALKVVGLQVKIALAAALAWYVGSGAPAARAALFGGAVAFVAAFIQAQRMQRAERVAVQAPARALGIIYQSAAIRFVLTLALFAAGLGGLHLAPLPLLATFALAQTAYAWVTRRAGAPDGRQAPPDAGKDASAGTEAR